MRTRSSRQLQLVAAFVLLCSWSAIADDGMWTFDNPPRKQLKELYGFEPTQEWLDHVRLSSVRFNDGGSGAFVSANGRIQGIGSGLAKVTAAVSLRQSGR